LSALTTFTVLIPVVVPEAIVILAVSLVELTNVVELTVMPAPNLAMAPASKCDPRMSTERVAPLAPLFGELDVGAGAAMTVRHPVHVAEPAPVVAVTLRAPMGAVAVAFTLMVNLLLLTKVVETTVTPVPDTELVAPDWKLLPFTAKVRVPPWPSAFGLTEEMVGPPPLAPTVKMPFPVRV
jgi:hypothetical protein